MRYTMFGALTFTLLCAGCVPVTEPLGDIEKAEPDKALVGNWVGKKEAEGGIVGKGGIAIKLAPAVKGNPTGLMCLIYDEDPAVPNWFYLTTVGKERYAVGCAVKGPTNKELGQPDFSKEGDYSKWAKSADRRYAVFRLTRVKDDLIVNYGDRDAFADLMKAEKIECADGLYFKPPPGWLEKYLEKNGPGTLFPIKTNQNTLVKVGK